jgi:hypothetical protein
MTPASITLLDTSVQRYHMFGNLIKDQRTIVVFIRHCPSLLFVLTLETRLGRCTS